VFPSNIKSRGPGLNGFYKATIFIS